ncbi:class I SAM-dependent methyltransferase [Thermodesulfobacteriota bacterium B35]
MDSKYCDRETLQQCPICNGSELGLFLISNGENIIRCSDCDLLFVNPRPTSTAIRRLFEEEYIDNSERVAEDFTSWRTDSLRREARLLSRLRPEGGRLLDIGTASGAFLGYFTNEPQWQVEGVEPSRFAAREAAKRYQVPVHPGFLSDQAFPDSSFDVVTSLDAFCFHPDPVADLKEIVRILRPGGLVAMEIPGLRFRLLKNSGLLCRLIYGEPVRLNAGVHLFYYSRITLGRLMARFGFSELLSAPERSPLYGHLIVKMLNHLYFGVSGGLYRLSKGASWVPVPKEFLVYRLENK